MITLNLEKIKFNKEDLKILENDNKIEALIKVYNNYCDANEFGDLKCPLCKKIGTLHFHKKYERNLVYDDDNKTTLIKIIVLECEYCKNSNDKQKYHALLPNFLLPYHAYEAGKIIATLYNRIILNLKLEELNISHKLFYDWLKKINKYLLASSIILKIQNKIKLLIKSIYNSSYSFLNKFYEFYNHPYFLFRTTCVDLCVKL